MQSSLTCLLAYLWLFEIRFEKVKTNNKAVFRWFVWSYSLHTTVTYKASLCCLLFCCGRWAYCTILCSGRWWHKSVFWRTEKKVNAVLVWRVTLNAALQRLFLWNCDFIVIHTQLSFLQAQYSIWKASCLWLCCKTQMWQNIPGKVCKVRTCVFSKVISKIDSEFELL